MTDWNGFKGAAKRLDDIDLPREGHAIGVGEDILHGFIDCESRGKGFDSQGRPLILFEPHVFYRCLPAAKRAEAVKQGLAYAKWKTGAYGKESAQYGKLERAMKIDEVAALKACSWGMFQVLGENHKMIGFDTPHAMVRAMMADEELHLRACIDFIRAAGIDDDLRRLDAILKERPVTAAECAPAVRVYNGPGYAKNGYHTKMAASLNRWRKIPDTPWSPGDVALSPETGRREAILPKAAPDPILAKLGNYRNGKFNAQLLAIQTKLDSSGWPEVGTLDGKFGDKTSGSIASFKAYGGISPADDQITAEFLKALALFPDNGRQVAEKRATTTIDDLKKAAAAGEEGAKDVAVLDIQSKVNKGVGGVGAAVLITQIVDKLGEYSEVIEKMARAIDPIKDALSGSMGFLMVGIGFFGAWQAYELLKIRLQKHRTARDVSV